MYVRIINCSEAVGNMWYTYVSTYVCMYVGRYAQGREWSVGRHSQSLCRGTISNGSSTVNRNVALQTQLLV